MFLYCVMLQEMSLLDEELQNPLEIADVLEQQQQQSSDPRAAQFVHTPHFSSAFFPDHLFKVRKIILTNNHGRE